MNLKRTDFFFAEKMGASLFFVVQVVLAITLQVTSMSPKIYNQIERNIFD